MFQTDQSTAASSLPTPASAGTQGYFTNGNPASGVAATIVDADFLNMTMLELVNIVTAAGLTLSKTTYNQVLLAIKRLVQNQAVLTDTGAANAYAAANTPPLVAGTWANGVTQQIVVAHTNTGASTYSPDTLTAIPIYGLGLQPLQGGEMFAGGTAIMMKQTITGVNSGNPIVVLLECSGGAQQIAPATQSQHAMQLGQFSAQAISTGLIRTVKRQTFGASGTYTPSTGMVFCDVELYAGGGGGGGAAGGSGGAGAGGGGAGGYCRKLFTAATIGASQTVTIGALGTGGAAGANNGGAGGNSSFGALLTANGGTGGSGASSNVSVGAAAIGGGGGTASGGDVTLQGATGGAGIGFGSTGAIGGAGGFTIIGHGGGQNINSAGSGAVGAGAAGGGASATSASAAGGNGYQGFCFITEFCTQ